MGCRRHLGPPMSDLNWYDIKSLNHIVYFLCLSFSLPFGAANKHLSGLTHYKRLGPSFQLSISAGQSFKFRSGLLLCSYNATQGIGKKADEGTSQNESL